MVTRWLHAISLLKYRPSSPHLCISVIRPSGQFTAYSLRRASALPRIPYERRFSAATACASAQRIPPPGCDWTPRCLSPTFVLVPGKQAAGFFGILPKRQYHSHDRSSFIHPPLSAVIFLTLGIFSRRPLPLARTGYGLGRGWKISDQLRSFIVWEHLAFLDLEHI
jgi:hypothetical protein